jgi:hypothetical protein
VHTLNPVAQGGTEEPLSSSRNESATAPEPTIEATSLKPIPRGYGKIIRDENGAVLRIELPEDTEEVHTSGRKGKGRVIEAWGDAMDDSDEETEKMIPAQASTWIQIGSNAPKQDPKPIGLGIGQKKDGKELVTGTCLHFETGLLTYYLFRIGKAFSLCNKDASTCEHSRSGLAEGFGKGSWSR